MPIDLRGRAVLVTGASSGIGAATALACAHAGMRVALFARRADRLEDIATRARSIGAQTICIAGSVDSDDDCHRAIDSACAAYGTLDAVIANAGYGAEAPAWSMPVDDIRAMFETNFYGSLRVVRPAIERMRAQRSGHAVLVSSCLSKIGVPRYAAYCATKAAQDHFARAMRHELAHEGVAVSSVHPIGTRTEFFDQAARRSPQGATLLEKGSRRFMQSPERVGDAIVRRLRRGTGAEVWTSTGMRLALAAAGAFPGLADAALRRAYRRRMG